MKKFLKTLIFVLPVLLVFAGCDLPFGNDDDDDKSPFEGTWVCNRTNISATQTFTFSGSSFQVLTDYANDSGDDYDYEGKGTFVYSTSNSSLTITLSTDRKKDSSGQWGNWGTPSDDDKVGKATYKIEGSILSLKFESSSTEQVYTKQ